MNNILQMGNRIARKPEPYPAPITQELAGLRKIIPEKKLQNYEKFCNELKIIKERLQKGRELSENLMKEMHNEILVLRYSKNLNLNINIYLDKVTQEPEIYPNWEFAQLLVYPNQGFSDFKKRYQLWLDLTIAERENILSKLTLRGAALENKIDFLEKEMIGDEIAKINFKKKLTKS